MLEVNWAAVRRGLLLSIILWFILGDLTRIIFGDYAQNAGSWIGYLIATIIVGYRVGEGYMNGAIHGALVGIIGGIVGGIIIGILIIIGLGAIAVQLWPVTGVIPAIIAIIIFAIIGAIGGAIGILIKGQA